MDSASLLSLLRPSSSSSSTTPLQHPPPPSRSPSGSTSTTTPASLLTALHRGPPQRATPLGGGGQPVQEADKGTSTIVDPALVDVGHASARGGVPGSGLQQQPQTAGAGQDLLTLLQQRTTPSSAPQQTSVGKAGQGKPQAPTPSRGDTSASLLSLLQQGSSVYGGPDQPRAPSTTSPLPPNGGPKLPSPSTASALYDPAASPSSITAQPADSVFISTPTRSPHADSASPSVMDLLFGFGRSSGQPAPTKDAPSAPSHHPSPHSQPLSPGEVQQQPRGMPSAPWPPTSATSGVPGGYHVQDDGSSPYASPSLDNRGHPLSPGLRPARDQESNPDRLMNMLSGYRGGSSDALSSPSSAQAQQSPNHSLPHSAPGAALGTTTKASPMSPRSMPPPQQQPGIGGRTSSEQSEREPSRGDRLLQTLMAKEAASPTQATTQQPLPQQQMETQGERRRRSLEEQAADSGNRDGITRGDKGSDERGKSGPPLGSPSATGIGPTPGGYQSLGQALAESSPNQPTTNAAVDQTRDSLQDSAVDPDFQYQRPSLRQQQQSGPAPVPPTATKPLGSGPTPFDFTSPFDMLRDASPQNKGAVSGSGSASAKMYSSGSTATPQTMGRPLPNPNTSFRGSQTTLSSSAPPTSQASTNMTADTDLLSGSPAPGPTASTPATSAASGGKPLAPPQKPQPAPVGAAPSEKSSAKTDASKAGSVAPTTVGTNTMETPDTLDEEGVVKGKYLAHGFVTRLREESQGPLQPSAGLTLRPGQPPQQLTISTYLANEESLYLSTDAREPSVLPIAIFPSPVVFAPGVKVAVNGLMTYATKVGRIRVISQDSGAKMLLKRHEARVVDMGMGQQRSPAAGRGGRSWRCLASVGADGRLVIWKVPVRFEEDSATYEVFAEVVADTADGSGSERFTGVKWHPRDPATLLVSTNDRRIAIVRLDRGNFAAAWKRGAPVGRVFAENDLLSGQDVLNLGANVWAMSWSPDGTAFALVTDDHTLRVRQTSKPEWKVLEDRVGKGTSPITKLDFLSDPSGRPQGFVIARAEGTKIDFVEAPDVAVPVASIDMQPPPRADEDADSIPLFCHLAWQQPDSTLLVSCSTRGSIFAFHVDFGVRHTDVNGVEGAEDDVNFIERLTARRTPTKKGAVSPVISSLFVDHIAEVATPKPVISFNVDATRSSTSGPAPIGSIFCINPTGISQIHIPREVMRPTLSPPVINTRRQSLAGEILVDVQVEKKSEPVEPVTFSEPSATSSEPAPAPIQREAEFGQDTFVSPRGPKGPREYEPEASPLTKELRKMEDNLHHRLARFVEQEVQRGEQRIEEDRAQQQQAEISHQETLLNLVSTTLTKNTSKTLESTIKNEIRNTVLPAVSKIVERSVDEHFRRGLDDAMKKSIPVELEKLLFRSDIASHMARSFSANVGPTIERNFAQVMTTTLAPAFTASASSMLSALVQEVRGELTGVRKEIVTEQSDALKGAEDEIRQLRGQVESMGQTLGALQDVVRQLVGGLGASPLPSGSTGPATTSGQYIPLADRGAPTQYQPPPGQASSSGSGQPTPQGPQYQSPPQQRGGTQYQPPKQQHQQAYYGSPRGQEASPRDRAQLQNTGRRTPTSEYEDMFLRALSDKDPSALGNLIDTAPSHRLEAVFARDSQWNRPALSQAVVLTLAHRLSEEVVAGGQQGSGGLGKFGTNRLRWIWSAVSAVDYKDPQTAQYLGRVLDLCATCLLNRQTQLKSVGAYDDAKGIGEVLRLIEEKTRGSN